MALYNFAEAANTPVAGIIGASLMGGGIAAVLNDIQTNGSGQAINTNNYSVVGLFKTGSNSSRITLPSTYSGNTTEYVSAAVMCDGTAQGYTAKLYQSGTSGSIYDRIQFQEDGLYFNAPFLVSNIDFASGDVDLHLYISGGDLILDIYQNASLHEQVNAGAVTLARTGTGFVFGYDNTNQEQLEAWDDGLAADNTAPTFTSAPSITDTTDSGHTISATLDEDGTIYAVRLPDGATAPSSAQVKAGQDSTGSAALEAKSVAATASVSADLVFSTADSSTAYDYYIVAEDDEGTPNIQAAPVLVNGTTNAPSLSIVSTDASMQRGTDFQMVIANPPFIPTAPNIALVSGDDTLTCVLVEDLGSEQYRLTFQVGDLSKQVSATGYAWSVNLSVG